MKAANANCPAASLLSDFGLGKLDPASAETVARHLENCVDCRQKVAELPGDGFIDRLRDALGRELDDAPASASAGLKPTEAWDADAQPSERFGELPRSPGNTGEAAVPPELANHPDYEAVSKLGRGGMGVVYLARNPGMDRLEVLKVVNKALVDRPEALERFQREIRAAAMLRHPNIVAAYSAFRAGDLLVFAMEYVSGQDLSQVVKQHGPLPVPHAAYYIYQVASGLEHAHEKRMVHRDIKPNNLMLAVDGKRHVVKILDFGLAKASSENGVESGVTKSGQMLGTPDYVAPEQALDARKADIRADIYSLGCTFYFLLSGRPPFQGTSLYEILEAHQKRQPNALNRLRPDVPAGLAAVVGKMMAKDPLNRYQTPAEVARALVTFFQPDQMPARGDLAPTIDIALADPKAGTKRYRRRIAGAAAFVLAVGVLLPGIAVRFNTPGGGAVVESNVAKVKPATDGVLIGRQPSKAPKRFACEIPTGFRECWSIDGDELVQSSLTPGACLFFGDPNWTDYDFSFEAKLLDRWELRTYFRYQDALNNYSYVIGGRDNTVQFVESISDGKFGPARPWQSKLNKGEWYHVEIKVRGDQGDCFLDGHHVLSAFSIVRQSRGRVGWCMQNGASVRFRNILVKHVDAKILLEGLPELPDAEAAQDDAVKQRAETTHGLDGLEVARTPFSVEEAKQYQDRCARALNAGVTLTNSIGMPLTLIPPGEFIMGSSQAEVDSLVTKATNKDWQEQLRSESPRHRVLLTTAFYLGTFEVTQQQYTELMDRNPSQYPDNATGAQGRDASQHPVETVSWFDAIEFCNRLSQREALAPYYSRQDDRVAVLGGEGYRLPTEAEWEFACRAGTTSPWPCGYEAISAWKHGVLSPTGGGNTQPVGNRSANAFGIYDMIGNVWEWCWDGHAAYDAVDVSDPTGPNNAALRVLRGSSYNIGVEFARSAKRWYAVPSSSWSEAGFRVARTCAGQTSSTPPAGTLDSATPTN